jgi:hypothetical protein
MQDVELGNIGFAAPATLRLILQKTICKLNRI